MKTRFTVLLFALLFSLVLMVTGCSTGNTQSIPSEIEQERQHEARRVLDSGILHYTRVTIEGDTLVFTPDMSEVNAVEPEKLVCMLQLRQYLFGSVQERIHEVQVGKTTDNVITLQLPVDCDKEKQNSSNAPQGRDYYTTK